MADPLALINKRHAAYLDSMVESFEEQLRIVVNTAQAKLTGFLQRKLSITDGIIDQSGANTRILRFLDDRYMAFLNEAGYDKLLNAFTGEFAGQQVFLTDTLEYLGFDHPGFTGADLKAFTSAKLNAVTSLEMVAETAARTATQQAMFSLGGMSFAGLVESIGEKLGASIGRAKTVADSAMSTFYRTMTNQTFGKIEADLPVQEQKYIPAGPDDAITRPFCRRLIESGKSYTRAQIESMNNGQLPNPMITFGGWNCRHVWLLMPPEKKPAAPDRARAQ
jgi:hypothetical protein